MIETITFTDGFWTLFTSKYNSTPSQASLPLSDTVALGSTFALGHTVQLSSDPNPGAAISNQQSGGSFTQGRIEGTKLCMITYRSIPIPAYWGLGARTSKSPKPSTGGRMDFAQGVLAVVSKHDSELDEKNAFVLGDYLGNNEDEKDLYQRLE